LANGEAVLRRIRQARDADLTGFMASVNAWVQEAGIEAQQVRAATLQKLALKASQKRVAKRFAEVAAQPGVEQITASRPLRWANRRAANVRMPAAHGKHQAAAARALPNSWPAIQPPLRSGRHP
jgi:hypothetical protein